VGLSFISPREINDTYNDSHAEENNFYDTHVISSSQTVWHVTLEFLRYGVDR